MIKKVLEKIGWWLLRKCGFKREEIQNLRDEVARLEEKMKHMVEVDHETLTLLKLIPPEVFTILPSTIELVNIAETGSAKGTSGEYKRHVVYANLIKKFPDVNKKILSLAIEFALWIS
jgi:hypothetical protein